ncbi:10541_t:CDS:2 [Diversispora eburnea]|uniref:10541_t:CDS:1 n=1 Tax=Diversispora eburnea TaxID=1213867 RepID=A0A9N8W152_9GLOM|nr:10541_t:CDS:2 [Diversispora eburnea]
MSSSNTSNATTRVNTRNLVGSWRNNNISNSVVKTLEEYEDNLKSVATVTTVQVSPEQLQLRSSLHFMKNGIRPDPRNENGGAWFFKVNKTNTAVVWRELLMLLIDDDIFGISVSSRYNSDIFTIWNKNSSANEKATVIEKLKETLNPIELQSPYYKAVYVKPGTVPDFLPKRPKRFGPTLFAPPLSTV